jgi:hypothetical protein
MVSTKFKYTGLPTVNSFLRRITESQIFDQVPTIPSVEAAGPLFKNTSLSNYNFLTLSPIGKGSGSYRARFEFSYKSGVTLPQGGVGVTDYIDYFGIAFMNRQSIGTSDDLAIKGIIGYYDSTTVVNLSNFTYITGNLMSIGGGQLTIPTLTNDGSKISLDMFVDINVNEVVDGSDILYVYGADAFFKHNGLKKTGAFEIMDDALTPNLTGFAFCGSQSGATANRFNLRSLEVGYTKSSSPLVSLFEDQ